MYPFAPYQPPRNWRCGGKGGGRRKGETEARSRTPHSVGTFIHFLSPLGGREEGPQHKSASRKAPPPIPDRRAEAGSGLPCESGISERTGEWLCLAVCHFILPSFLISDSTRGFCRCKCALQLETQPFCSTGVKLAHTASHPPPHSRVSSLPISKRHFLKSADRKGS